MSTPTDITDLSTTAASNSPAGSEAPSVLDNEIRALASIIKQEASSGSNIASGGTITPPAAGRFFHVTGTTTITTIASTNSWNGRLIVLEFDGALTLTHHATNLALPGGANITTADGDIAVMVQESSGAWHCVSYLDASSHYIGPATTDTLTNKTIDANNNTISNIVIGAECTGASTALTDTADLTYNADTDVSSNGWVVDEDNMASDLATKVPTQQSVKAYADTKASEGPAFFVSLSSNQTLNDSTNTRINFDIEDKDTDDDFDNVTNYRFTPSKAGYYIFTAGVYITGTDILLGYVAIRKNGTIIAYNKENDSGGSATLYLTTSTLVYMNGTTDYVDVAVYANMTGSGAITNNTPTFFSGSYIRSL